MTYGGSFWRAAGRNVQSERMSSLTNAAGRGRCETGDVRAAQEKHGGREVTQQQRVPAWQTVSAGAARSKRRQEPRLRAVRKIVVIGSLARHVAL